MQPREFIDFLNTIEKLKTVTRHSWNSNGRRESVAEHSWRLAVMALLCKDEYPQLDINKVIKMCLIHDFGEAVTGDIPSFYKTDKDEHNEEQAVKSLLNKLPHEIYSELSYLFAEMKAMETDEAKLYKALDNMEAVISHNQADISTWLPMEYEENLVYGEKNCQWSEWTMKLRQEIKNDTAEKLRKEGRL